MASEAQGRAREAASDLDRGWGLVPEETWKLVSLKPMVAGGRQPERRCPHRNAPRIVGSTIQATAMTSSQSGEI